MGCVLGAETIRHYLSWSPPLIENLLDSDTQIQPNGVDLSLREIRSFDDYGQLDFSNGNRVIPVTSVVSFGSDGWVHLDPGCYIVTFNEIINLPVTLMAIAKPRSSLLRLGATIETAVWDAGYRGRGQCLLVIHNPRGIRVFRNARIVQLVFLELVEATAPYSGIYQGENL
jgi:dUTP pyrophosphatase